MSSSVFTQETLALPIIRNPFPVEQTPVKQGPTILDSIRDGVKKLAPVGRAIVETGRWLGRHKIGVSYAIGAVAAGVAIYNAIDGYSDLQFYDTVTQAANTAFGVESEVAVPVVRESATENLMVGGAAATLWLGSTLVGMTLQSDKAGL